MYLLVRPIENGSRDTTLVNSEFNQISLNVKFNQIEVTNTSIIIARDDDDMNALVSRFEDIAAAIAARETLYDTGKAVGYWKKSESHSRTSKAKSSTTKSAPAKESGATPKSAA